MPPVPRSVAAATGTTATIKSKSVNRLTRPLAAALSLALAVGLISTPIPVLGAEPQTQSQLTINILKGEGGRNSIKTRTGEPIELSVADVSGKPVAGAQIIVQLPTSGPSGSFPGGQLTKRTTTGPNGQAVITGFVPNDLEGRFNVKITADSGAFSGMIVVSQTNVAEFASEKPKSKKGLWILLAVGAGAGAAAGIALGGGGSSSSSPGGGSVPPSVTVSVGTVTVGGPR